MLGGPNSEEEVVFGPAPLPPVLALNRSGEVGDEGRRGRLDAKEEEGGEEEAGVDVEVEKETRLRRSSIPAEGERLATRRLKSSVRMRRLSRSMGEPLDSEYSTPKWRRWARA